MNIKTAVVMFAVVVVALGLAAATLVVPIAPQAHAQQGGGIPCTAGIPPPQGGTCRDFGQNHKPDR